MAKTKRPKQASGSRSTFRRPSSYKINGTTITTIRLSDEVSLAASLRAAKMGLTRTEYIETLLRKDLGMGATRADTVFG